jgi:hypothetical protein
MTDSDCHPLAALLRFAGAETENPATAVSSEVP